MNGEIMPKEVSRIRALVLSGLSVLEAVEIVAREG